MSYNKDGGTTVSGLPGAAVTQYRILKDNGSGAFIHTAASTDLALGVLVNDPDSTSDAALVQLDGVAKVEAGAAVSKGVQVMANASGKAITFVGAAGNYVVGYALEAASGDGSIIPIHLRLGQPTS